MKEASWSEVKDFLIFTKRIIFLFKNYEAIVHKLVMFGFLALTEIHYPVRYFIKSLNSFHIIAFM